MRSHETATATTSQRLAALTAAIDRVVDLPVERLDEPGLQAELGVLETCRRRLEARAARAADALTRRRTEHARNHTSGDRVRAGQRAERDTRDDLAAQLEWTPTQTKDAQRLGRTLRASPGLAQAVDAGEIAPRNATTLARTLDRLDPALRPRAERRLAGPARTQSAGVFGDTCRAVLAELDPEEAVAAEVARHARRTGSVTRTPDGMTRLYAEVGEVDGSLLDTAIDAHRRPDRPGEHRRPEQATADALIAMARAALEGGRPSTNRGVRPHVVCTIPIDTLRTGAGPVELDTTTVPLDAVRHLLDDAGWSFVITGRHQLPIAVSRETGTVPVGLWRALQLRDQVCIADGCELPARWCDVMHLDIPDRHGGPLQLDNTGLGCRRHHRAYDNRQLTLHRHPDGRPALRARDGPSP